MDIEVLWFEDGPWWDKDRFRVCFIDDEEKEHILYFEAKGLRCWRSKVQDEIFCDDLFSPEFGGKPEEPYTIEVLYRHEDNSWTWIKCTYNQGWAGRKETRKLTSLYDAGQWFARFPYLEPPEDVKPHMELKSVDDVAKTPEVQPQSGSKGKRGRPPSPGVKRRDELIIERFAQGKEVNDIVEEFCIGDSNARKIRSKYSEEIAKRAQEIRIKREGESASE